jgi:hypothetical protein
LQDFLLDEDVSEELLELELQATPHDGQAQLDSLRAQCDALEQELQVQSASSLRLKVCVVGPEILLVSSKNLPEGHPWS